MKYFLFAATVAVFTITTPVFAADVGISLSIGQPGFYGQLDIGDYPQPQVIYSRPVIVERTSMNRPPIYLHVPRGHAKHWSKHCRKYNACGEQVYFVQDGWYNREYVPRYKKNHRDRRNGHRGEHGNEHSNDGNDRGRGRDH